MGDDSLGHREFTVLGSSRYGRTATWVWPAFQPANLLSMRALSPSLCPIVEGINFRFQHGGNTVRALVPSNVLESAFGAASDSAGWMRSFHEHEGALVATALEVFLRDPFTSMVVLREGDFLQE